MSELSIEYAMVDRNCHPTLAILNSAQTSTRLDCAHHSIPRAYICSPQPFYWKPTIIALESQYEEPTPSRRSAITCRSSSIVIDTSNSTASMRNAAMIGFHQLSHHLRNTALMLPLCRVWNCIGGSETFCMAASSVIRPHHK